MVYNQEVLSSYQGHPVATETVIDGLEKSLIQIDERLLQQVAALEEICGRLFGLPPSSGRGGKPQEVAGGRLAELAQRINQVSDTMARFDDPISRLRSLA